MYCTKTKYKKDKKKNESTTKRVQKLTCYFFLESKQRDRLFRNFILDFFLQICFAKINGQIFVKFKPQSIKKTHIK